MVPCGKYPERSSAFDESFFKKKVLSYLRLASVSYHRALACLSTDNIILFTKHCTAIFLLLGLQSPTMGGTLASLQWKVHFFDILFFALWSTPCSISVDQTDYINKTLVDALFPTDLLFEQILANAPPLSIDESCNR
jgi:hypothetical protein